MAVVFNEAEAAGGFVEPVESHNKALDLSASKDRSQLITYRPGVTARNSLTLRRARGSVPPWCRKN